MRKFALKIATLFACTALCFTGAALSYTATSADEQTPASPTQTKTELIAPQTYQEYLPLQAPSGVAVCENYTAIADGNAVYVYYQAANEYVKYTHSETVSKLQFDEERTLYFSDATAKLYALSLSDFYKDTTLLATAQTPTCSSFLLADNTLYYTIVTEGATTIYSLPAADLTNPAAKGKKLVENLPTETPLAYLGDELYYLEHKNLRKAHPQTGESEFIAAFSTQLKSIVVMDNLFACVTDDNGFAAYGLNDLFKEKDATKVAPYLTDENGYVALCSDNGFVYTVQNNVVRQYSAAQNDFTAFEICSSSAAQNRLNGATAARLVNDLLYVADVGNQRISVYDVKTNTFRAPIATELSATHIAADEHTLLVAAQNQAVIYSLQAETYGTPLYTMTDFDGNVIGVENVYGKYYLATANNFFYSVVENEENAWQLTGTKHVLTRDAKLLVADAAGMLYTVCGNDVYRFTETQFLSPSHAGEQICKTLPPQLKGLALDFDGGLYGYSATHVYRYIGEEWQAFETLPPSVYGENDYAPQITSVTFGYEENAAYLLLDNNYITVTDAFGLPTVKTIAVENADEQVFAQESVDNVSVVKTQPNALLITFDLQTLTGAEYFPYLSYHREQDELTAIKIGETSKYTILAVFDDAQKTHVTYLTLKTACTPIPETEHSVLYTPSQQKTAYLTNAVQLYKYPYLTDLLTVRPLTRGESVTLLGEMNSGHYAYYRIRYTQDGVEYTGYIPQSFVTLFNPITPETQHHSHGVLNASEDSVWRLAYIMLGLAAICILTDYLLLRTPKDDNDD